MDERPALPLSRRLLYDVPRLESGRGRLRQWCGYIGPGFLVAVGYMDPGNWATDIAGGSAYGYQLLWVVVLANVIAILLQHLSLKLGIVSGRDLARSCRERYARTTVWSLWAITETAIIATDLAEIIGTAIALHLLLGLPLRWGVALTVLEVMLVLGLQRVGMRRIEIIVLTLMALVAACFVLEVALARASASAVAHGLIPGLHLVHDPAMLYLALGIIGATVMPHNLYLHSALVRRPTPDTSERTLRSRVRLAGTDSAVALCLALIINAAILIVAAAAFHAHGRSDITTLTQAHDLLGPLLGSAVAGAVFAVGLLACGLNATLTGTLAGQVVMEGFLDLRTSPLMRRLVTRGLAVIPAALVVMISGDAGLDHLLIVSQVLLAIQLPCAAIPLLMVTSDVRVMGAFANGRATQVLGWTVCSGLCAMSLLLGWQLR